MKRLFLDDVRTPADCMTYVNSFFGYSSDQYSREWTTVKNYEQFCQHLDNIGIPDVVSFDHDLADEHYQQYLNGRMDIETNEKTGLDCAKYLVNACLEQQKPLPKILVHSMNPIGRLRIIEFLNDAIKKLFTTQR